jgi:thiamine-monophosphate kinase
VLSSPKGSRVTLGIGDDAAAWRPSRSHLSVITTDALVENVHFTRRRAAFDEIGHRALAANLSDIAAMGATARLATIALGLPKDADPAALVEIYRGIDGLARSSKVEIAGGDIVRAAELFISITVVGEVRPTSLKRRSGARARDVVAVTGELGGSRADLDGNVRGRLPLPRLAEGAWLGRSRNVHALMDISDGLSTDLARMTSASQCGAIVDNVPVAQRARAAAEKLGEDPARYAAAGGEDFELLAAIEPRSFAYLSSRFSKRFGRPLLRVGTFRAGNGVALRDGASEVPLEPSGWDHLAR